MARQTRKKKAEAEDGRELARGGIARIYRDGTELVCSVLIPVSGPFTVRQLPPGSYLARDEQDPPVEQAFIVNAKDEFSVVMGGSGDVVGGAEPGGSYSQDSPMRHVGAQPDAPDPIYPDTSGVAAGAEDPTADVPVPGEPGSALIEEVPAR